MTTLPAPVAGIPALPRPPREYRRDCLAVFNRNQRKDPATQAAIVLEYAIETGIITDTEAKELMIFRQLRIY